MYPWLKPATDYTDERRITASAVIDQQGLFLKELGDVLEALFQIGCRAAEAETDVARMIETVSGNEQDFALLR